MRDINTKCSFFDVLGIFPNYRLRINCSYWKHIIGGETPPKASPPHFPQGEYLSRLWAYYDKISCEKNWGFLWEEGGGGTMHTKECDFLVRSNSKILGNLGTIVMWCT